MSEHRIRLDDEDLARIEKSLVLCLRDPGAKGMDERKAKELLSRFRRTRLHGITGRPTPWYIPRKRDETSSYHWKDDLESYLEELDEYL